MPRKINNPQKYLESWCSKYKKLYISTQHKNKCLRFFEKLIKYGKEVLPQRWRIHLFNFIKYDVPDDWYERCLKIKNLPNTVTLEKLIITYGINEGKIRWEIYKQKQAYTNSFEYKNKKYGMTEEQFKNYNKNRSSTLELMCKRYGEIEGKKRWKSYCDKQKDAGCSLKYFQEIYGNKLGLKKYKEVCSRKALTLTNYILKYGEIKGKELYENFLQNVRSPFSKISQKLFWDIFNVIKLIYGNVYFGEYNKEFGTYDSETKTYKKYDFVIPDIKIAIEFDGDHYHGNPKIYKPSDHLKGFGMSKFSAKEIWKRDRIKTKLLEKRGFKVFHVWELDYRNNSEKITQDLLQKINYYGNITKNKNFSN